ncbi:MAG: hypothetical protein BGO11_16080 [Solirubrobacterales bacterium 70-9]|nr:MAG: hypothetical protein BGO11_16080 [Solirubrobacterales bacterium 70-9]
MKRPAVAVLVTLVAALLVAGCGGGSGGGSSSGSTGATTTKKATAPNAPAGSKVVSCEENRMETEELRATAVDCNTARATMEQWEGSRACTLGEGSRSSCSLGDFRCQAVKVDKGAAVSCEREGADVTWISTAWMVKKSGG